MGVPTKQERFLWSKCDRCGKTTKAMQNGIGDLFTLDPEIFGPPMGDQGAFCERCCTKYDKANWEAWFRKHRPGQFEDEV